MPREPRVYLQDILEAIGRIDDYVRGQDFEAFAEDGRTVDAVLRNLEVVGEAAKRVPETLRVSIPEVEWRKISGMRDVIAHAYFEVDLEIVWDVIRSKLPGLRQAVNRVLSDSE